jgi:hypothetical protein
MRSSRSTSGHATRPFGLALGAALAAGLVLACFASEGSSPANPGAPAGVGTPINWPQPLMDKLRGLGWDGLKEDPSKGLPKSKKFEILSVALANLNLSGSGGGSTAAVNSLKSPGDYVWKPGGPQPKYVTTTPFQPSKQFNVSLGKGTYYDYNAPNEDWVDFANADLGGGVFGNGMLQEESMVATMPELADAAAMTPQLQTRDSKNSDPLASNPTPLRITNVHRTIQLDSKTYGDGWIGMSMPDLYSAITVLPKNQQANVIAMAVPKLKQVPQQTALETVDDLFNTFAAAYSLVPPGSTINTGPIGTGDYRNSTLVVYVMQNLAAQQAGVKLVYWGLSQPDKDNYDKVVNKITTDYSHDKGTSGDDNLSHLIWLAAKDFPLV